ncbi:hypothetical protein COK56_29725 [Bacillus cereus]|uniref:hypothetical protein n=1 Tax=Bacillus cereus TaxID=1396 RepID=UPI000BF91819|nr:hypothetical protein [Bacillus cereus]PFN11882.1 hypothetical protein COJ72_29850 [Bacillus cereus]PFS71208.1 hypothetical protein COK56_29725 [Bacillus cereus]
MRTTQSVMVDKIKHKLCGKTFFENGNYGLDFDYRKKECPYCRKHVIYDDLEHLSRENADIRVNYKTGEVEVSSQAYGEECLEK